MDELYTLKNIIAIYLESNVVYEGSRINDQTMELIFRHFKHVTYKLCLRIFVFPRVVISMRK